ncbi:hypothetical protein [Larkinella terrae]|uniref:Uncharacterized protein n=1 Tax=Larkinella terrae TaxID=2025311 RepID=A0A7K0ESM5_9BACT|nr:hypothetical protein [Larkinella terrae]MRS64825.1 hypothetical protein [Larkinella terrae]
MMNHKPKNTTIFTPFGRAELFFQVVNCDHIMFQYHENLIVVDDEKRQHDVSFSEIASMLSGNVLIDKVPKTRSNKHYAISFYKNRYYYTVFYLEKRADSPQLFAVIVTSYATNKKEIREKYESYRQSIT